MPKITIELDEDEINIIQKRAEKNLFSLKEQIEDILRKSAVRTKNNKNQQTIKIDDKLVAVFSRDNRGRKKKK